MRCYHFSNMYLSSIQVGIQSAHAQMELFVKYNPSKAKADGMAVDLLYEWAERHKTMICLNAGFNSEMLKIAAFLKSEDNPYPWSTFCESEEAMGGLLTNIAIVLPERIYSVSDYQLAQGYVLADGDFTDYEVELIRMKNQYGMAS